MISSKAFFEFCINVYESDCKTFILDKDDFKLGKFTASSAYYFEPYYGKKGNGDVTDPENIDALEDFIQRGVIFSLLFNF